MLAGIAMTDDLALLYVIAALFGLGYGGIIAMYAFIVREYFPAEGLGGSIAVVYLFGTLGMALGGYTGGLVFDVFGSYRSEEHTSELQSLMRISYAVFCLNKKINTSQVRVNH